MKTINQDAARLAFLFNLGIINSDEVISWADAAIIKEDKPSYELIEVSTSDRNSPASVSNALSSLCIESDVWTTVSDSLPTILAVVEKKKEMAPLVARAFYHIAISLNYTVPNRYSFFTSAEDLFDLADSGFFTFDEIYHDFVDDIRKAMK